MGVWSANCRAPDPSHGVGSPTWGTIRTPATLPYLLHQKVTEESQHDRDTHTSTPSAVAHPSDHRLLPTGRVGGGGAASPGDRGDDRREPRRTAATPPRASAQGPRRGRDGAHTPRRGSYPSGSTGSGSCTPCSTTPRTRPQEKDYASEAPTGRCGVDRAASGHRSRAGASETAPGRDRSASRGSASSPGAPP